MKPIGPRSGETELGSGHADHDLFMMTKYTDAEPPHSLATWQEARTIGPHDQGTFAPSQLTLERVSLSEVERGAGSSICCIV